jgi:hypothetical protein
VKTRAAILPRAFVMPGKAKIPMKIEWFIDIRSESTHGLDKRF